MEQKEKNFLLKDVLFNKQSVGELAMNVKKAYAGFKKDAFIKDILKAFPKLELKERITCITENLQKYLPDNYPKAIAILIKAIPKDSKSETRDFVYCSYSHYVEKYGCTKQHLELSLQALGEFTKCFSAEGAIRPFLNAFPKQSMAYMKKWSKSKNVHQRRLSSEGLRPSLPWCMAITTHYIDAICCLDVLYSDSERYVTRSVANHLNDISKFDIKLVVDLLKKWKKTGKQNEKEMQYIINHSLRTAVKRGEKEALQLLGFKTSVVSKVQNIKLKKKNVKLNEYLEFEFDVCNTSAKKEKLVIDYKITYAKPKGSSAQKKHSTKVFKLKTCELKGNQEVHIAKKHLFKPMTTKKLYTGMHKLTIQLNGTTQKEWEKDFILKF